MNKLHLLILLVTSLTLSAKPYLKEVAKDYKRPIDLVQLPDSSFLVLEQEGKIYQTQLDGKRNLILDWSERITRKGNEQGLLAIALSPDFAKSGRLYLNLNNLKDATEIWRVTVNPSLPAEQTQMPELLLTFEQPFRNHNGGWLGFGPQGNLFIGTGDGGAANDPKNKAQDLTSLLGKLLRIDVSGDSGYTIPADNPRFRTAGAHQEIFAYGLRNPWRCAWHGKTLYLADVGQNAWEEINAVTFDQLKGANFGWRLREGDIATPKKEVGGEKPGRVVDPVYVYPHDPKADHGGLSVTGGYVYEGSVKELKGRYIFADYNRPRIWSFKFQDGKVQDFTHHSKTLKSDRGDTKTIVSFAQDNAKELYVLCFSGSIFKLTE